MNGEIPSVPITTLAGISSLTDLLPEMPLPSPLPQTLSNKSLLFHPRVAEEAQILLSVRDDALVPQLIQSLVQTSADHIELKDHYAGTEPPVDQQQNIPELLKAILHRNPSVFKGPHANSPRQPHWNQVTGFNSNYNQASPASYGQASPSYPSPCGSRNTPQGSPAPPAAARLPHQHSAESVCGTAANQQVKSPRLHCGALSKTSPVLPMSASTVAPLPVPISVTAPVPVQGTPGRVAVDSLVVQRVSVITDQSKLVNKTDSTQSHNGGEVNAFFNSRQQSVNNQVGNSDCISSRTANDFVVNEENNMDYTLSGNFGAGLPEQLSRPMSESTSASSIPRTHTPHMAGSSPAQASVAPIAHEKEESRLFCGKDKKSVSLSDTRLKEPVVRLNRLTAEDQALMQRSLREFAEKSPTLACKLGITSNHKISINASQHLQTIDSGSDSEGEPKNKSKYFKAREKERELQRQKEKEERKKVVIAHLDHGSSLSERIKKRKRSFVNHKPDDAVDDSASCEDLSYTTTKTKLRKVERKLVPVLEKLSIEELMETNTYQRFNRSIEVVLENTEDLDVTAELDEEADAPAEAMIPKYQLQDLCSEAAKLKTLGAMESVPPDRLVRLLNILEKNIRDGTRVSPIADPDDDEDEIKMWMELTMERVMRAADASLTSLYIMTSPNMPKRIYLEDIIDRIVIFTKYQLQNTIYPSFDLVYRVDPKKDLGSGRKKRAHAKEVREKSILTLYNKLHELVSLLAELLNIQVLTDTAVLHASSMGVAPFFVESVSELQLSALKLVTTIFTKYEKHRRLLLDDILASIARLPSSKRSLRSYRLNSEEHIQMLTALVLQLIQCVVVLPERFQAEGSEKSQNDGKENEEEKKDKLVNVDRDVLIISKYETAYRTAANFLSVFLNKCGSKTEEIDYRPLFENFVQDLLTTVNKPEWPATELLLSLLGKLLVSNFVNKGIDMSLRVASLDYLGVVAARLRKDAVLSQQKLNTIDQIISEIKAEEQKELEDSNTADKKVDRGLEELDYEEERTQFLQRVLLDYLAVNGQNDQALTYARHFYLAQWYWDADAEKRRPSSGGKLSPSKLLLRKKKMRKKRKDESSAEESSGCSELDDDEDNKVPWQSNEHKNASLYRLIEIRKQFLVSKIRPFQDSVGAGNRTQVLQTYIDYESAELISRYLASKRPFSQSFDRYLQQILFVLTESSIAIRTKAMKCLTMVVEADPAVLGRNDMQRGVRHSFLDQSTSVREAAVDLVGKFVLSRPELIDKYYDMLSTRILDTGVSVRKRVIKILKDICMECPEFPKIPEICVKMIRRVNDEEGIRKLVMEVFQNMWFTPIRERPSLDSAALLRKVMNITDVVAASRDMGLEWFEQLLLSLFKPKEDKEDSTKTNVEPPKALLTACKQIVDCLIENVLRLEETSLVQEEQSHGSSQRLVACLTTLYLFAKIRPQLLVDHAITLQPYLSLKCQTQGDYQIISSVARTLELVVPLMEHPSETFLAQLEEDSVKLILQHDRTVVASCLSCLGSVVNNVTRNFKLIRDCFLKYYGFLRDYRRDYEKDPTLPVLVKSRPFFRRALFTVGLLLRHFDFTDKDVIQGLEDDIKDQVCDTLAYFVQQPNEDIQLFTLKAIGSLCIRHYDFMLGLELKTLYHRLLTEDDAPLHMRTQVLNNIELYLQEEERRMIKQDQEWAKLSKQENLKEMGDVSSGMASTVIQLYLKEILESFLHPNVGVRQAALKVIQLILQQGLVHPVQIVPYLICMSTDVEKVVSHSADKQLQDIEKKYPGFIHMKSQSGIRLSYKLQKILQSDSSGIVRGYRVREGEFPGALNGFLYSILRNTKQQRRALVLSVLKQFDEQVKTSLSQMLYLSDNLAYFPYQVQDEPLFIIHHIDIMISVSGTNLLQSFREALLPGTNTSQEARLNPETGATELVYLEEEDDDEDEEVLLGRVPDDTTVLQECITASQGCLLLLVLKQHLKDLYGISDAKITQYSPSESAKVYEKTVNRRSNSSFDPKATLQKLRQGSPASVLDETARRALIEQYLDFKQLMLKFDPDDPDDDEPSGPPPKVTIKLGGDDMRPSEPADAGCDQGIPDKSRQHMQHEQQKVQEIPQRVPKLTIVPPRPPEVKDTRHHRSHKTHKPERHKKHRHKKKRKMVEDSEDSGNEYSDPEFLV
ncbi:Nipped-B-like protein [Cryptotermes secundus]|uniref:Nipped-B protein n=1 Tax=Cryptotermes secundus TaxID=105785 RepID=A0A2J7Q7B0_9NEOP|nr:nipped-B-like protein A [Cryptotermes secundus]XP_023716557.1 nipped-B-like protein A [Cryptotermes secundus]XP_023716558.1 nipped-B-like protein A [Cryptotermes secundus]PNF24471.1 Nipped-B-like protein [Cryptotermes secundus]PNF24472.1 Nipped-B-like protein [Cryptotermes secundus]